jgi:hypothetical protein
MAIVMPSEAHDCDESEKVLSNRQNLSPNASRGRIVDNSVFTPWSPILQMWLQSSLNPSWKRTWPG